MTVVITDRWGNDTIDPDKKVLDKTLNDLFLDGSLPHVLSEISITDGSLHLDITKSKWVHLEGDGHGCYMKNVDADQINQLWNDFYEGRIDAILAEPWIDGIPAFNGDL